MGLSEAGVKLLADGADGFLSDMKSATGAVSGFGAEGEKSGGLIAGLGDVLGSVAKVAAGVVVAGFGAMTAALGFAVSEAMGAQAVNTQLESVLKSTGGAAGVTAEMATGLAESLSEMTRFGDETILSGENMLLTFTNIGKDVFPLATETMLDMAQAMGGDLKGTAIQLGKALQDPVGGISALSRVGVNFTDDQKKMIQSMVDAGDVAGAQALILKELQVEFGGSAKAAGKTFAGQLDILKNKLGNVAETVGMAVLPLLSKFMDGVITPAIPIIEDFSNGLAAFFQTFSDTGSITQAFDSLAVSMYSLFGADTAIKIQEFGVTLSGVYNWFQDMLPVAIQYLSGIWTGTLVPAFQAASEWFSTSLMPVLQTLWSWLQLSLPVAIQVLTDVWNGFLVPIFTAFSEQWLTVIQPALAALWTWLQENIPPAIAYLSEIWSTVLYPKLQEVGAWISETLVPILGTLVEWVLTNLPVAIQFLADIWTTVLYPALVAWDDFVRNTLAPALQTTLGNALAFLTDKAMPATSNFITTTMIPGLTAWNGAITEFLVPGLQSLGGGLTLLLDASMSAFSKFITDTIIPGLMGWVGVINEYILPGLEALGGGIQILMDGFLTGLSGAIGGIKSGLSGLVLLIEAVAKAFAELEIPSWFTPGSPTPLELGIKGINSAMKTMIGETDTLTNSLSFGGVPIVGETNPVYPAASASQISNTTNNSRAVTLNFTGNYSSSPSVRDSNDLALMLGLAAV